MIKYHTNRELSRKLDINLAKWKRWSREFLPPDPLGGMQSGYARQYSPDDAFIVYLGGHIVANLNFSVPGARKILKDLHEWLLSNGFYSGTANSSKTKNGITGFIRQYIVFVVQKKNLDFTYIIRGVISTEPTEYRGYEIKEERYVETSLHSQPPAAAPFELDNIKVLNITTLLRNFINKLDLTVTQYQALS